MSTANFSNEFNDAEPHADDPEDGQDHLGVDDAKTAGVEHLQRAARELIAASRAFLDVAEDVVERPEAMNDLADLFRSLSAQALSATLKGTRANSGDDANPFRAQSDFGHFSNDDEDGDDGPVQRIPVL